MQVAHIDDITTSKAYRARDPILVAGVELGGYRTVLSVPMLKDQELVGLIVIYRQEVRAFSDKQIELVKNFAAQAVIAIENTRLLNELRESLQQQTATADVLQVISSSPGDLEPVFEAMLANATRICEAKFGMLYLWEGEGQYRGGMNDLPSGWDKLRLSDVAVRTSNVDPSRSPEELFELYSVPSFSIGAPDRLRGEEIKSSKQAVEPDDVLLCKIVPHINRVWTVAARSKQRQIASGEWIVYRTRHSDPHYLRYCLSEAYFREQFMATVAGVGGSLMRARPSEVSKIEIPLAPLPEQRRIVAKIDSLSAKSKRCRDQLDHIPRLAEKYKQAILAAGFRGELTRDWRARHRAETWSQHQLRELEERRERYLAERRGSRLKPFVGRLGDRSTLPEGWFPAVLADVGSLQVGYAYKSKWYSKEGVKLLRGANIAPGSLTWEDEARLPFKLAADFSEYALREGDIVIAMDRPIISTGLKVARIRQADAGSLLVQRVARYAASQFADGNFVWHFINSQLFIDHAVSHSTGTDLPHISSNDILTAPLPLPVLTEQREIVRRMETGLAWIDRLAAEATSARKLIDHLDQAILAKAFRGELVPQDPTDEPASVLLDRIRAERAVAPVKVKRGPKRIQKRTVRHK